MPDITKTALAAGIFVGGQSRRMGEPKGLLHTPGDGANGVASTGGTGLTILEHLLCTCEAAGLFPIHVTGDHSPYRGLLDALRSAGRDYPALDDDPAGVGPIGGLRAALRATDRPLLTLACDMPFVQRIHIERLMEECAAKPNAAIVTPATPHFEAMFSVYRPARVLPAIDAMVRDGVHALRRIPTHDQLRGGVATFDARAIADALVDWDTPDDVSRGRSRRERP